MYENTGKFVPLILLEQMKHRAAVTNNLPQAVTDIPNYTKFP